MFDHIRWIMDYTLQKQFNCWVSACNVRPYSTEANIDVQKSKFSSKILTLKHIFWYCGTARSRN